MIYSAKVGQVCPVFLSRRRGGISERYSALWQLIQLVSLRGRLFSLFRFVSLRGRHYLPPPSLRGRQYLQYKLFSSIQYVPLFTKQWLGPVS